MTLLLLVVLSVSVPAAAQRGGFTESFDDPTLPSWSASGGSAAVVDGRLVLAAGAAALRTGPWQDFTLTLRVRYTGSGQAVVRFEHEDSRAYAIHLASGFLRLMRDDAELGRVEHEIPAGEWARVQVLVVGGQFRVTLNDRRDAIVVEDPEPVASGNVQLAAIGASAEFDDVALVVPDEEPGSGVEPGEPTTEPAGPETPGAERPGLPAYQAQPWVRTGGPIGGLGYDIRYSFDDHDTWYVTDSWSGFYISTDDGATWELSNEGIDAVKGLDAIPVFCVTVDPHEPSTLWLGTEIMGRIYKSVDGGRTWTEKMNGIDLQMAPTSYRGFTVDPRSSDIVYAMGEIGSPAWTTDHSQKPGPDGLDSTQGFVYKSTDGGESWKMIWRGDNLTRYLWIDPRHPDTLYVSTGIFDRHAADADSASGDPGGVGVLKSTDGGATWHVLNEANGLLDLFVSSLYMKPGDPDVLLAAAAHDYWSPRSSEHTGGVYRTEDGGAHWTRVLQGENFSAVEFSVSEPSIAYAASPRAFYRSEDGGKTWRRFTRSNDTWGPSGLVAGFTIDLQCDPDDPMRLFVNQYLGGNFLTEDGGETWTLSSRGYTGEHVVRVAVAPGEPAVAYAGSRSGIYRTENGGTDWIGIVNPPEGMTAKFHEVVEVAVDPSDSAHACAAGVDIDRILVTRDHGQTWEEGGLKGTIARIVFAPSDPTTLYASVTTQETLQRLGDPALGTPNLNPAEPETGLYASRDGGDSWTQMLGEAVGAGTVVAALAVHPADPDTLYASVPEDGLLMSSNGGQSWVSADEGLPQLPVLSIAIALSDPDVLFAGIGFGPTGTGGGGGIYGSTDGGSTWKQLSAGVPPEAVILNVAVDPIDPRIVYAADFKSGVYYSTDSGSTWKTLNEGLLHRQVRSLALSDDGTVLYAGIWGDGVYRLGTPAPKTPQGDTPAADVRDTGYGTVALAALSLGLLGIALLTWRRASRRRRTRSADS